ncbi:MAG: hypothetical protein MUC56_01865 [Thermoanaerobaculales bacterium]|jgi:hypothetical protein|nr:hypothetical protein [Thermoanaerobaculales bacterium]
MDWIDQNLDAYRVIAEILTDLRPLVRDRLETRHGKEWFRDGIPEHVFDRLIQNKEQEASIDWYENRYQEVIGYAVFPDLFEIIIANPGLFDPILKLAPGQSLLNTRFLELEVMRAKIGRAREISEAEINFLTSFHLRFRRAVQELAGSEATAPPEGSRPARPAAAVPPRAPATGATDAARPDSGDTPPPEAPRREAPGRPPMRRASAAAAKTNGPAPVASVTTDTPPDAVETLAPEAEPDSPEESPREAVSAIVKRAMESGDHQAVLREIYREVTGIAEVIWSTNEIPTTSVWDRVSTNRWYESNFSKLELRPLSDFYELVSQVRQKRKDGASKSEIQSFLNSSKFATILLALRDLFQRNNI